MAAKYEMIVGLVFFILCSITNGQLGDEIIIPLATEELFDIFEATDAADTASEGGTATTKATDGGTIWKAGPYLITFVLGSISGTSAAIFADYLIHRKDLGNKECSVTYNYYMVYDWPEQYIYVFYSDVNNKTVRVQSALGGEGNLSYPKKISLDSYSILEAIFFLTEKDSDICMQNIDIVCGAGTGVGTSLRHTNLPMGLLKEALRVNHYTAKGDTYTKTENENNCVYIYGDSGSSKRLRGIGVNPDIFECGTDPKKDAVLKCIAKNIEMWSGDRK